MLLRQEIEELTRQIDEMSAHRPELPRQTGGVFHKLIKSPRRDAPKKQLSLIPTMEDEALATLKRVMPLRKSKKARIKHLAKRHSLTEKQAQKLYNDMTTHLQHELEYHHYVANKAYYDWQATAEHREYCRTYLSLIDKRVELVRLEFEHRVAAGLEHVVAMEYRVELDPYLDRQFETPGSYHGPMSHVARTITENDARVLWVNKALTLESGDESTLFNYRFLSREELQILKARHPVKEQRVGCHCGAVLDYNTAGFNRKLGISPYQCLLCLGVDEEYARSIRDLYRSSGCPMFI